LEERRRGQLDIPSIDKKGVKDGERRVDSIRKTSTEEETSFREKKNSQRALEEQRRRAKIEVISARGESNGPMDATRADARKQARMYFTIQRRGRNS